MISTYVIKFLNIVVTLFDVVLYPVNYLVYKRPWRLRKRALNDTVVEKPHEFILCANNTEMLLKPARPELTCSNRENMMSENLDTMSQVFDYAVKKYSNNPCLGTRKIIETKKHVNEDGKLLNKIIFEDRYDWQSYREVSRRVTNIAKGLYEFGIKPNDKVLIYADTCPEWLLTALACFRASITIVTLYTNLGHEGVVHGINQVSVSIIITSQELLPTITALKDRLPQVKTVVVFESKTDEKKVVYLKQDEVTFVPFRLVEAKGFESKVSLKTVDPDDIAVIMYTSGSTGEPKGVMLTHANLVSSLMACCALACNLMGHGRNQAEAYLAYLPLAHIFELTHEIIVLSLGIKVGYSSPATLTDASIAIMPGHKGDINILRPSVMPAVPVILDRIYKSLRAKINQKGELFGRIFDYFVGYRTWWVRRDYDTPILNKLLFGKIQASLGGQLKTIIAGGAPLSGDVHDFLRTTLGITLAQGYGLTETVGGVSLSNAQDISVGRVGQPLPGVQIKLRDWDEGQYVVLDQNGHQGPRGEILIGGPIVAKGYYNLPDKTDESFFVDPKDGVRWFQTGDIGQLDPTDGALKIIDRKKDLVKLQMGEYVSLGKVEAWIKVHSLVDNVCIVADSCKTYCVALIVPDLGKLKELAMKLDIGSLPPDELCHHPDVVGAAHALLYEHAKLHLERFEIPKRLALLPGGPWTPDTGLVTAALKLRRKPIQNRFRDTIASLYYEADPALMTTKMKLA